MYVHIRYLCKEHFSCLVKAQIGSKVEWRGAKVVYLTH